MKSTFVLLGILLSFNLMCQDFTEVQYMHTYTKRVSPLFKKQDQAITIALVKRIDYHTEQTDTNIFISINLEDVREEIVGSSTSISFGSIGSLWGSSASGGIISSVNTNKGVRIFTEQNCSVLSKNYSKLFVFMAQQMTPDIPAGLKLNVDSAMSIGVLAQPLSSNRYFTKDHLSWIITVDQAEFNIDYEGGMTLLKTLAHYADYILTNDEALLTKL